MTDSVRAFHRENLEAAFACFFEHGDIDPQVHYLKDGELHIAIGEEGARANQAALLRAVVEEGKPDIVNFTAMMHLKRRRNEPKPSDGEVTVPDGKPVLVSVTFDPNGDRYFSAFDVRREGDKLVVTGAAEDDLDQATLIIRDDNQRTE